MACMGQAHVCVPAECGGVRGTGVKASVFGLNKQHCCFVAMDSSMHRRKKVMRRSGMVPAEMQRVWHTAEGLVHGTAHADAIALRMQAWTSTWSWSGRGTAWPSGAR